MTDSFRNAVFQFLYQQQARCAIGSVYNTLELLTQIFMTSSGLDRHQQHNCQFITPQYQIFKSQLITHKTMLITQRFLFCQARVNRASPPRYPTNWPPLPSLSLSVSLSLSHSFSHTLSLSLGQCLAPAALNSIEFSIKSCSIIVFCMFVCLIMFQV